MAIDTNIPWCHSTFNPWIGCEHYGPGCDFCYAEDFMEPKAAHLTKLPMAKLWGPGSVRHFTSPAKWLEVLRWNREAEKSGRQWRVFCASLCDVFEDRRELDGAREWLWALVEATPHLTWMLLTKRIKVAHRMMPGHWMKRGLPPHVWLGASICTQKEAEANVPALLKYRASVRFVSCEPQLEPLYFDLPRCDSHNRDHVWTDPQFGEFCNECAVAGFSGELSCGHWLGPDGISMVITGGESDRGQGHQNARPYNPEWARIHLREGREHGIAVHVKQMGSAWARAVGARDQKGEDPNEWPEDLRVREFPEAEAA